MIFKFFNKDEKSNNNNLIDVACLMIHAAKIDENYTDIERKIIKNTLKKIKYIKTIHMAGFDRKLKNKK